MLNPNLKVRLIDNGQVSNLSVPLSMIDEVVYRHLCAARKDGFHSVSQILANRKRVDDLFDIPFSEHKFYLDDNEYNINDIIQVIVGIIIHNNAD